MIDHKFNFSTCLLQRFCHGLHSFINILHIFLSCILNRRSTSSFLSISWYNSYIVTLSLILCLAKWRTIFNTTASNSPTRSWLLIFWSIIMFIIWSLRSNIYLVNQFISWLLLLVLGLLLICNCFIYSIFSCYLFLAAHIMLKQLASWSTFFWTFSIHHILIFNYLVLWLYINLANNLILQWIKPTWISPSITECLSLSPSSWLWRSYLVFAIIIIYTIS